MGNTANKQQDFETLQAWLGTPLGASLLQQEFKPKSDRTKEAVENAVKTLASQVLSDNSGASRPRTEGPRTTPARTPASIGPAARERSPRASDGRPALPDHSASWAPPSRQRSRSSRPSRSSRFRS